MQFKRTLAMLLAMVMILGMVPVNAFATDGASAVSDDVSTTDPLEPSGEGVGDWGVWDYEPNEDGTATLYGYSGEDYDLTIPATIDGYTVTVIASGAFAGGMFGTFTLPNTLTAIERRAFNGTTFDHVRFDGTQSQWEALLPNIVTSGNGSLLDMWVECMHKEALVLDQPVTVTIGAGEYAQYSFEVPQSGYYKATGTGTDDGEGWYYHPYVNLANHSDTINGNYLGIFYAEAGEVKDVYVNNYNDVELTTQITFSELPMLTPGDSLTLEMDKNSRQYYGVVLPQSGNYALYAGHEAVDQDTRVYTHFGRISTYKGYIEYMRETTVDRTRYTGFRVEESAIALCCVYNENYSAALSVQIGALSVPQVQSVAFQKRHLDTDLGVTYFANVDVDPAYGWEELTYTVGDESILRVFEQHTDGCWLEPLKGGETTLTVTAPNGITDTVTVFVDAPEELKPGVPSETVILDTGEAERYLFAVPETGIYCFHFPMTYSEEYGWDYPGLSCYKEDGGSVDMVRDLWAHEEHARYVFYSLEAGTTVNLSLTNYSGYMRVQATLTASKAEEPQQIIANMEQVKGMVGTEYWINTSYGPNTSYGELQWSIADESIALVSREGNDFHVQLLQAGKTVLTVSCGGAILEIPVIGWVPQAMESGVIYENTLEQEETFYYTFTSEEGGVYCFAVPFEQIDDSRYAPYVGLEEQAWRHLATLDVNGRYVYYYDLGAGEEYTFRVYNNSGKALNTSATIFPEPEVESLTFNHESIYGKIGQQFYITLQSWAPAETRLDGISFEIDNSNVAQIMSTGWRDVNIMLMDSGKATLTARGNGFTAMIPIEVEALPRIGLNETVSPTLQSGEGMTWAFTPETSGFYTFSSPMIIVDDSGYNCELIIESSADALWYEVDSDWGPIRWQTCWIEAGTRLRVSLRNYHGVELSPTLTITETPAAEEVYAGPITLLLGDSTRFSPGCSPDGAWGKLSFSVEDESIARITDSDYGSVSLESVAVGTTTLTVTLENGFSATSTISVVSPMEIDLDETVNTEISGTVDTFFQFTAPETGMYTFKTPVIKTEDDDRYAFISWHTYSGDDFMDMGEQRTGSYYYRYYYLAEGTTVVVNVSNPFADRTISSSLTVEKTVEATGIAFTQEAVEDRYENYASVRVQFLPEGAYGQGYVQYETNNDSVAWVNWHSGMECQVYLAAEGKATITAIVGQWTAELPITVQGNPKLTLGETYEVSLTPGYDEYLDFTAPADGVYRFFVPYYYVPELNGTVLADVRDRGIAEGGYYRMVRNLETEDGAYRFYYMTKDTTIHMVMCNNYGMEMASSIIVENAPTPERIYFETSNSAGAVGSSLYFSVGYEPYATYADLSFSLSNDDMAMFQELGRNYCRVQLLKAGTVTLTVSCGELSLSQEITVSEPLRLRVDEPLTMEMEFYDRVEMTFAFPETGMYMFKATYPYNHLNLNSHGLLFGSGYAYGGSVDGENYRVLYIQADAGSLLSLSAEVYFDGECTFTVCKTTEPTAMSFTADTLKLTPGEWGNAYLNFIPDNGYARVTWSVKDENIVRISHDGGSYVNMEMLSAGTTTLTATCGDLTAEMTIIVYEPTALKLGEQAPMSVNAGNNVRAQFTADEDGIYAFYTPYLQTEYGGRTNLFVYTDGGSGEWNDLGAYYRATGHVRFVRMAAGANVRLRVQNEYGMDMDSYVLVEKAAVPTELKLDTTEIRSVPNSYGYVNVEFAPETAYGDLIFAVKDKDIAEIEEMGSASCRLKLLKLGETTLTVSCGEVSVTIDVIVEPPAELKLDETLEIPGLSGPKYVNFTAPETGLYGIETPHVYGYEEGVGSFGTYISAEPNSDPPEGGRYCGRYYYDDCAVSYLYLEKDTTVELVIVNYNAVKLDAYAKPFKATTPTSIAFEEEVMTVDRDYSYNLVRLNVEPFGSYENIRWSCSSDDLEFYGYGNEMEFCADMLGSWVITATTESGKTASVTINVVERFDPPDYGDPEVSVAEVVTGDTVTPYDTLAEAIANAKGGYVRLNGNFTEDITVTMDTYLDVNGGVIFGNVTVEEGATLYAFDTATADYVGEDLGGIMGKITGNLARSFNTPTDLYGHNYKYMAIQIREDVWTFHRYYLTVKSVILAPCVEEEDCTATEVNYRTVFKCNEVAMEYITAHGAKFVGEETVYANYFTGGIELIGGGYENNHVVGLGGTMKTSNTVAQNAANAMLAPTVSAYITLSDGTVLESTPVSRSLQQMAAYANGLSDLTEIQKMALGRMYDLFKPAMDTFGVDIGNIKTYASEYWGTDTAAPFAIVFQPESAKVPENDKAVFTVAASGEGLTYRWQYSSNGGDKWSSAPTTTQGYSTSELTVVASTKRNGFMYRCVITDAKGNKLTTDAVTLTVKLKLTIVSQPESVATSANSNAVFTVAASGDGLTYRWQYSSNGGEKWSSAPTTTQGYNTSELTVVASTKRNGFMYRCVITDAYGDKLITDAVILTVE